MRVIPLLNRGVWAMSPGIQNPFIILLEASPSPLFVGAVRVSVGGLVCCRRTFIFFLIFSHLPLKVQFSLLCC